LALALLLLAICRHRLFLRVHSWLEGCHQLLDFLVALVDQVTMASIKPQPLFEGQDMFRSPVSFERVPNGLFIGLDAWISQLGQHRRIPLACQDGVRDRQFRQAGDVVDDVLELHVHLGQRLLHGLHVLAGHLDQIVAVPHERTDARTSPSGRNAERSRPNECRCWIHWHS
jgi:hypothetical protein